MTIVKASGREIDKGFEDGNINKEKINIVNSWECGLEGISKGFGRYLQFLVSEKLRTDRTLIKLLID